MNKLVTIKVNDGNDILTKLWNNLIARGVVNRRVDSSRFGLVFSAIATELNVVVSLIESYMSQFTLQTCTDRVLVENMARMFAVRRLASKSKVVLKFYRIGDNNESLKIPAGFNVQSSVDSKIIFKTISDVYLWKGMNYVTVLAYSTQVGSKTNVEAGTLTRFASNGYNTSIGVINEQASFGGYDDESIESLRNRANGFRYERNGTLRDIQRQMWLQGYSADRWTLIEPDDEFGTYTICIDTDSDNEFDDVRRALGYNRVAGITQVFKKATRLYVDLYITIYTTGRTDYTPTQKDNIFSLTNTTVQKYFANWCTLGVDLSLNSLKASINSALSSYEILAVEILLDEGVTVDGANMLKVGPQTRIYPNKVLTSLKYEEG